MASKRSAGRSASILSYFSKGIKVTNCSTFIPFRLKFVILDHNSFCKTFSVLSRMYQVNKTWEMLL